MQFAPVSNGQNHCENLTIAARPRSKKICRLPNNPAPVLSPAWHTGPNRFLRHTKFVSLCPWPNEHQALPATSQSRRQARVSSFQAKGPWRLTVSGSHVCWFNRFTWQDSLTARAFPWHTCKPTEYEETGQRNKLVPSFARPHIMQGKMEHFEAGWELWLANVLLFCLPGILQENTGHTQARHTMLVKVLMSPAKSFGCNFLQKAAMPRPCELRPPGISPR